jgi:dienelactone hydrolase
MALMQKVIFLFSTLIAASLISVGNAQTFYDGVIGPLSITKDGRATLAVPVENREMPLRIVYPDQGGPYPIIVFSHGTFSSSDKYNLVVEFWAERGYVVILPNHLDANYGIIPSKTEDMIRIIHTRISDMSFILDNLDAIEGQNPGLKGKLNRNQIIAAGHSIGTQVVLVNTGQRIRNPTNNYVTESSEDRFMAAVMLSDPGKMAMMPDDTWKGGSAPTFLSTGSEDYGLMGDGRREAEYQNEILTLPDESTGDKYLLLIERGDHYFGGLIHRDVDKAPDYDGLAIFNAASLAFMDAHTRDAESAWAFLKPNILSSATDGRFVLTVE